MPGRYEEVVFGVLPAKLFDTLTFLPSFCPSSTPTTRFRRPLPERPKWSAAERRTRGATETVRETSERVSAVVAGITKRMQGRGSRDGVYSKKVRFKFSETASKISR